MTRPWKGSQMNQPNTLVDWPSSCLSNEKCLKCCVQALFHSSSRVFLFCPLKAQGCCCLRFGGLMWGKGHASLARKILQFLRGEAITKPDLDGPRMFFFSLLYTQQESYPSIFTPTFPTFCIHQLKLNKSLFAYISASWYIDIIQLVLKMHAMVQWSSTQI